MPGQLAPLLDGIRANLGTNPDEVSADAGYCSANLRTIKRPRIESYIATGRQKHGTKSATAKKASSAGSMIARMSTKLKRAGYRSRYRLRKQIVETVFPELTGQAPRIRRGSFVLGRTCCSWLGT